LYCWGFNFDGSVGIGTPTQQEPPVQVGTATDWTAVSAGESHTCAIRGAGALYCWGSNGSGQVGDATTTQRNSPKHVGTASTWVQVGAGLAHTCAIRSDDGVFCWGDNAAGRLGDGTTTSRHTPTQEVTHGQWFQVSAGEAATCAIGNLSSRPLYCWGFGQPGTVGAPRLVGIDHGDFIEPLLGWVSVSVGTANEGLRNP
jgi:alpha-tubulin suppressor-like RCC1 family protein